MFYLDLRWKKVIQKHLPYIVLNIFIYTSYIIRLYLFASSNAFTFVRIKAPQKVLSMAFVSPFKPESQSKADSFIPLLYYLRSWVSECPQFTLKGINAHQRLKSNLSWMVFISLHVYLLHSLWKSVQKYKILFDTNYPRGHLDYSLLNTVNLTYRWYILFRKF